MRIMKSMEQNFWHSESETEQNSGVPERKETRETLLSIEECRARFSRILERRRIAKKQNIKATKSGRDLCTAKKKRPPLPVYPNSRCCSSSSSSNVTRQRTDKHRTSMKRQEREKSRRRKVMRNICAVEKENDGAGSIPPAISKKKKEEESFLPPPPRPVVQPDVVAATVLQQQNVPVSHNAETRIIIRIPDPVGSTKHLDLSGGIF